MGKSNVSLLYGLLHGAAYGAVTRAYPCPMGLGLQPVIRFQASMHGRVHRIKGTRFQNPETGRMETVPGGHWHEGREGRWYDQGQLHSQEVEMSAWKWLWIRIRMELHEIAKMIRGRIN